MATTPAPQVMTNLGMASSGTTPSEQYEFLSETLSLNQELIRAAGFRGTRFDPKERVRQGRKMIGGDIVMQPTYAELRTLLPRIIGAESGGGPYAYTVSNTQCSAFSVMINRGNVTGKEWVYQNCRTARSVWTCAPGEPLTLTWSIEALTQTQQTISTWSGVSISSTAPFVWHDGVLTLGGTAYPVQSFSTTIDWVLMTDRFVNSQTRTDLPSTDCIVTAEFLVPYNTTATDTTGLYNAGDAVAGVTGDISFTWNPGTTTVNLQFSYANLIFPAQNSPTITSKNGETMMLLRANARSSGSTVPLICNLDPTN